MAHHDHGTRDRAEVLGVEREVVPEAGDVGEVLPHALVAAVGLRAPDPLRGAPQVELAVRREVRERALDIPPRERGVDRAHDVDLVRQPGGVAVISGRDICREGVTCPRRRWRSRLRLLPWSD